MVTVDNLTTTYNGLSTDQKPNFVHNGDKYRELDTGKTYIYNETGSEWVEMPTSSGGSSGGSSSGGGIVFVEGTITDEENQIITLNASFNDIIGYLDSGNLVAITYSVSYDDEYGIGSTLRCAVVTEVSEEEVSEEKHFMVATSYGNFYSEDPDEPMANGGVLPGN